jgi:hypothetical protein
MWVTANSFLLSGANIAPEGGEWGLDLIGLGWV